MAEASASRKSDGAKKKPRKQRFKTEYRHQWPFIIQSKKGPFHAFCRYCASDFTISHGGRNDVGQHIKTKAHEKNTTTVRATKSISSFFSSANSDESKKRSEQLMTAELMMAQFIVEHNLPISAADHVTHLFPAMLPDSKIASQFACKRTKTTHLIHEIAGEQVSNIRHILTGTVFSIATDGSTVRGATEQLYPVLVRYYDQNLGKIVTSLLSLPSCEGASTGGNIFQLLNKEIDDWELCVGFCSDNASVMTGKNNGVAAHIKRENPAVFISGCTCHLIHLAVSKAADRIPVKIDSLLIDMYYYLDKSTKQQKKLKAI